MSHAESITSDTENQQDDSERGNVEDMSQNKHWEPFATNSDTKAVQARQRRRIAQLEEKLEALESGRAVKEKRANYYTAQGRAIRRVVVLFDNVEDLVAENDRRYEDDNEDHTLDQDRLQIGYVTLSTTLPWLYKKGTELEYDEYMHMLKMLRQGADSARGDDTSKLKALVAEWVNREFKPEFPVDSDDKHTRGFSNDTCGRLLCPAEMDWNNPAQVVLLQSREKCSLFTSVRTGIRDRSEGCIVTDLSFPAYLYDNYTANPDDLEEGLFKGKILVQGYKAVFTSPSSAKDVEGDGDGADVIQNNRRAKKSLNGVSKVKKHVAQIINMRKVTPRSIAYIACLVRFSLSSVTSWRSIDGDFDYAQFWCTIVDFFERPPGRDARRRVDKLLEWWTRKIFGRSQRNDISDAAKASMSVNALARQRAQRDDAAFDSA
ncbi:hypothetical protein EDD22DRAFT_852774 [Suillus occidentalis]|nr:hypothetical protein EDD22DRAFT_853906 [Suillus occidentalis]KAG1732177.1 hypothetical protein EDD22DRAFT_852774 [Suillus occidentalis]